MFVPGPGGERVSLLEAVDWTVREGEHWALLGPNGAGKTTLVSVIGASRHPSSGRAELLGHRLGRVDVRELRKVIGVVDDRQATPGHLDAQTVVLTGTSGTIQPQRDGYRQAEHERAAELLELVGCGRLAHRRFATLSRGEQGRVRIARALASEPRLLVLDEPAAGLDLPGREDLVEVMSAVAAERPELATVTIAHGLEELAGIVDRALLLRAGQVVAAGPAEAVLTSRELSRCFGRPLLIERRDGRYFARAASDRERLRRREEPR